MDAAEVDLKNGKKDFFFAIVGIGEESSLVDFHKKSATDEVLDRAMQYVRDLPMPYTVCVLETEGDDVKINGKEQTAVLLMSYMRGEEKGMLFAKPFRRKNLPRIFEWSGPMQFIGSLPNLFSAEQ